MKVIEHDGHRKYLRRRGKRRSFPHLHGKAGKSFEEVKKRLVKYQDTGRCADGKLEAHIKEEKWIPQKHPCNSSA